MSPTAKQTTVSAVEATADRIRAINERIIDSGKQAGESSLRAYEELVKSIADAQEQAGAASADWVSAFDRAQARFTRELAEAIPSAARALGRQAEALAEAGARQARTVPGVPEAEAEVRGAVASERDLPIGRYDELTADEIIERLPGLSQADLGKVDAYERKHKNRTTVHDKIASLRE